MPRTRISRSTCRAPGFIPSASARWASRLPAGIGAKFGVGDTPVAVLIGDYGIQYTLNELGTAAEHKLPLIILLWNNERLGAIHDNMVEQGIQPNAVTLRNPDFQMLAKAYGCNAEKPASLKALAERHQGGLEGRWPDADRDDAAHGQWLEPPSSMSRSF